ncbi:MAG: GAF domain-containing protein [Atopobiaceae bacterium]|nr:GAF domain-containing protein [Atopobiaceae bacterium]
MRQVDWRLTEQQLSAFAVEEPHWLPALANASALLWQELDDVNWVGFYLSGTLLGAGLPADELFLGPFQGKVACVRIPWGRGVCGTAASSDRTLRVDDVHEFAGHIACDADSRSEIVVPLHAGGRVVGVLDIDSPSLARFSAGDQSGLEKCARALEALWSMQR